MINKAMTPFSLTRSTFFAKFPVTISSKVGNLFRIDIAKDDDQKSIKKFVETIHCHSYTHDNDMLEKEKEILPIIYPEFYDVDLWKDVIQFQCVGSSNNEMIGTLGIYEEPDGIIYISSFYVDESFRYQGVGRLIWNSCFEFIKAVNVASAQSKSKLEGRSQGFQEILSFKQYKVQLITAKDVTKDAYDFYIKEGFIEVPIEFNSPHCELVKMELIFKDDKDGANAK